MITELSKSLLKRYVQKAAAELDGPKKIKRSKGVNKASDKADIFNEASNELLSNYAKKARKDAVNRMMPFHGATDNKIKKNTGAIDDAIIKATKRNGYIKKAVEKIKSNDEKTKAVGDEVEQGIADIVSNKFALEKGMGDFVSSKFKKKPAYTMKNGKLVMKEEVTAKPGVKPEQLKKAMEMMKKHLEKIKDTIDKKDEKHKDALDKVKEKHQKDIETLQDKKPDENPVEKYIKAAMEKRLQLHIDGRINSEFVKKHLDKTQKDKNDNQKKTELEMNKLLKKESIIDEEFPTNSMGASSSTAGTGPIDTFDPLLFSGKKKKKKITKKG